MGEIEVSVDYGGRKLTLQTGKIAKQADASVICRYGDTVVLAAVVSSHTLKEGQDFFPLTVDFQEKYYAAGRIPGGFFKREARPSDRATLSARLIDRPCRPLFPEDYLFDTNVTITVLSTDGVNEPDIAASIAASAALHISDIPFGGPVGTCRVGMIDGKYICNIPPADQMTSTVELLVSGIRTGVVMVEGGSKEVSEQVMLDAIDFAHQEMQPILALIEDLRVKSGNKAKREYDKPPKNEALKGQLRESLWGPFQKAFSIREKQLRYAALSELKKATKEKFGTAQATTKEDQVKNKLVDSYFEELKAVFARELTVDSGKRIDGRDFNQVRAINCDVGLLPRVHGTGLFTRGETQVLSAVTLGTSDDEQMIDAINGTYHKAFMLHYNFPPFSVGEARPLRGPGRREIGHGVLAERALSFVIPPKDVFPYTLRLVAEVLESNGSSSMASVCSGSLALMDAGVPITKAVAGVAMGLIKENEKIAVLTDILGDEDHLGDMDFKVCGTADGITAFQMDLKIGGVSRAIMEKALSQAREGRLHILEKMNQVLSTHRAEMSLYAPRIHTIKIRPEKVREVIGSGGKVVRGIIEQTGVKIDIEDDGKIHIASTDEASARRAIELIQQITEEPEIGRIYEGKVTRIAEFGAFVEIIPGTDGLCHISELEHFRVRRVEDVLKEGEIIKVKVLDVDSQGKIRLSRKALLPKDGPPAGSPSPEGRPEGVRGNREATSESSDSSEDETGNRSAPRGAPIQSGLGQGNLAQANVERNVEREPAGSSDRGQRDRGGRDERPNRDRGGDRGGRDRGQPTERLPRDPRAAIMERNEERLGRFERGEPSSDREDWTRPVEGGPVNRDEANRLTRLDREEREERDFERARRPSEFAGDRGGGRHRGGHRSPDRGSDRGSDRGGYDRGPERGNESAERSLERGQDRGQERGHDRGMSRGGARTPDRGSDRGPARGYDRGPSRGPDRGGSMDRGDRGPSRGPARGGSSMERGPSRGPDRGPAADRGPSRGPARDPSYDRPRRSEYDDDQD